MAYIGQQPALGNYRKLDDISSSFDGIITQFEVTTSAVPAIVASARQCILSLNGVLQEADVSFTVGTTATSIAFTTAPQSGDTFWCVIIGDALDITGITDDAVTTASIGALAVTGPKIGPDAIDSTKIADLAIGNEHVQNDAITSAKIIDNAITLQKIQNAAVTFSKIASGAIADQSEAEAGVATDKLMTPERTNQAIGAISLFTAEYVSADTAIGATGAVQDFTHSLGATPKFVKVTIKCNTATLGYSIGDELEISPSMFNGTSNYAGITVVQDSTTISIINGVEFTIRRRDTGVQVSSVTKSQWDFVVRAWA